MSRITISELRRRGVSDEDIALARATQEAQRRNGSPVQPVAVIVGAVAPRTRCRGADQSARALGPSKPYSRSIEFKFFGGNVSLAFDYHDTVTERLKAVAPTPAARDRAITTLWLIIRHLGWESYECEKTAVELAKDLNCDQADMARTLKLLEDVGAIRRVRRGTVKMIAITPEGAFRGNVNDHGRAVTRYRLEVIEGGRNVDPQE